MRERERGREREGEREREKETERDRERETERDREREREREREKERERDGGGFHLFTWATTNARSCVWVKMSNKREKESEKKGYVDKECVWVWDLADG